MATSSVKISVSVREPRVAGLQKRRKEDAVQKFESLPMVEECAFSALDALVEAQKSDTVLAYVEERFCTNDRVVGHLRFANLWSTKNLYTFNWPDDSLSKVIAVFSECKDDPYSLACSIKLSSLLPQEKRKAMTSRPFQCLVSTEAYVVNLDTILNYHPNSICAEEICQAAYIRFAAETSANDSKNASEIRLRAITLFIKYVDLFLKFNLDGQLAVVGELLQVFEDHFGKPTTKPMKDQMVVEAGEGAKKSGDDNFLSLRLNV